LLASIWTKRLILEEHGVGFSGFVTATLAALLVGKAVLVTDNLPFMRRFDGAPLIQPILFKNAIYWVCVFIVRLAKGFVHFLAKSGAPADFPAYLAEHFSWSRFLSIQIWLMVLFLAYVAIHELNMLFGDGELFRVFFRWRSSEAKLTRRQRIRLLARLNRLTEATPIEAFSAPAHAELLDILHQLASPPPSASRAPWSRALGLYCTIPDPKRSCRVHHSITSSATGVQVLAGGTMLSSLTLAGGAKTSQNAGALLASLLYLYEGSAVLGVFCRISTAADRMICSLRGSRAPSTSVSCSHFGDVAHGGHHVL
jgi:hypothetical protein